MIGPKRSGGGWSSTGLARALSAWSPLVAGVLLSGFWPAPCAAQPASSGFGSVSGNPTGTGAQIPPGMTLPGGGPAAGSAQPSGAGLPGTAAGLPALPGAGGVGTSLGGYSPMSFNSTGAMQPPPLPMPPRAEQEQPVGPLPLPALVRLPSVSLDHYGDGSGTVGSYLIWDGQLPHQYRITRYHDGNGKVGGPIKHLQWITPHAATVNTKGTLSYGPPGLHPGFYGFGLSFHPGYGYGGNALGVGALGGYPCYGGPGYALHYGYPKFAYPYYEGIGQLYYDQPVVTTDLIDAGDFGTYTGASAYAYTHPTYTAEAAATGSFMPGGVSFPDTSASNPSPEATFTPRESIPAGPNMVNRPMQGRLLGMMLIADTTPDGRKGLKITSVLPGSTADNAGLRIGDVILTIDGHVTEQPQQFNTVVSSAAPESTLKLSVLKAGENREQAVTILVP